jgi:hypothetical protein
MIEKNIKSEISIKVIERDGEVAIEVSKKGEIKDFALMRELLENENNHFIRSTKALLASIIKKDSDKE